MLGLGGVVGWLIATAWQQPSERAALGSLATDRRVVLECRAGSTRGDLQRAGNAFGADVVDGRQ